MRTFPEQQYFSQRQECKCPVLKFRRPCEIWMLQILLVLTNWNIYFKRRLRLYFNCHNTQLNFDTGGNQTRWTLSLLGQTTNFGRILHKAITHVHLTSTSRHCELSPTSMNVERPAMKSEPNVQTCKCLHIFLGETKVLHLLIKHRHTTFYIQSNHAAAPKST